MNVTIPLDNISTTTRAITKSIMEQLLYVADFPMTKIIYNERGDIANTTTDNTKQLPMQLEYDDYVLVEYTEVHDDEALDPTAANQAYNLIMNDPALGIAIRPLHLAAQLECSVTYRAKSFNTLNRWLSRFRQDRVATKAANYHTVNYNYTIPDAILDYVGRVYVATEAVAGYGRTLKEYLAHTWVTGLSVRHNLSDTQQALALQVLQDGCLGMYTALPTEITTSKESPVSEITFSYTLRYDRVVALVLTYQRFVHNQVIDISHLLPYGSRERNTPIRMENLPSTGVTIPMGVNDLIPDHTAADDDMWRGAPPFPYYNQILLLPINIDTSNPSQILSLTDIVDGRLPPEIIALLIKYGPSTLEPYRFPLTIELYSVAETIDRVMLTISDGELMTPREINLRARYYLVFSLVSDFGRVDLLELRHNPDDLLTLFRMIDPSITLNAADGSGLQTSPDGSFITERSLLRLLIRFNSIARLWRTMFIQRVANSTTTVKDKYASL